MSKTSEAELADYQSAVKAVQAAHAEADELAKRLGAAIEISRDWRRFAPKGQRNEAFERIVPSVVQRFDFTTLPTGDQLVEAFGAWHTASVRALEIWRDLPDEYRDVVTPPRDHIHLQPNPR